MRCANRLWNCDERPWVEIGGVFGDHTSMAGDNTRIGIAWALLLCVAAPISACHKDSGQDAAIQAAAMARAKAPVVARKGPTAAELTAGMTEAVVQGKSQVPIALKFELSQRPKVGQPLDINLALITQVEAAPVSLKVSGGEGLTLAPDMNEFDFPTVAAGEVYKSKLTVTPAGEGVLVLGITVSLKRDELSDVKVFSIPIIADP